MAGSKAKRIPNVWDRLKVQQNATNSENARNRRVFNPQTISIPPSPEIPPEGNSGSSSGNSLLTAGGSMIGSIAYFPKLLTIQDIAVGKPESATSRVLDITVATGGDSSRIIASGGVGTTDLEFIRGASHAGQFLNIQGIVGQTLIIKNDASGFGDAGFNIRTQTAEDLTLVGNANVLLIFDSTQNQWAVISSITGGAAVLSLGQLSDVAITPDPPIANDILQFNTTTGLWENQPGSAAGGLLPDLSNLQANAIPPVDMSLNLHSLINVGNLLFTAEGSGFIDNVQTLSFFQNLHNIQSFGDRMDYQVDAPDSHLFRNGGTDTVEIRAHGISALDYRFLAEQNVTQNVHQIVRNTVGDMNFNVPDLEIFSWSINAVTAFTMSEQTMRGDFFTGELALIALPQGNSFPPDGWIQNNNNDVIIGSGGNAVNLTDVFNNLNSGQFPDDTFAIFNAANASKVATFNAASLSQTRTYTFQDANGRLAILDGLQQDYTVNVGFTNNNLVDVGGIFTTSGLADIGQSSNYFDDLFIKQIFFFGDAALGFKIGGDVSDGFDFIVPDTSKEFDFFFDGGTTPSWIIRPTVIDAQGGRLEDLEEIQFDGNSVIPTPSAVRRFGFDSSAAQINMPTGGSFNLLYNGTSAWSATETFLTGKNYGVQQSIFFEDNNSNPVATGQMTRNGADVLVFTSEGVKNMKDIGAGGGATNEISQGNSNVLVTDTGVGAITIAADAQSIASFSNSIGIVFDKDLNMSGNDLKTTGFISPANPGVQDIGTSSSFYNLVFSNFHFFNSVDNFLNGDVGGLNYQVGSGDTHDFLIGGTTVMQARTSDVSILTDLEMNDNDIDNVFDVQVKGHIIMDSFDGVIEFPFAGAITDLTTLDWGRSGQRILSASTGVNYYVAAGQAHKIIVDNLVEVEINDQHTLVGKDFRMFAALSHEGGTVGFYQTTPSGQNTIAFLTGSETLLQVIGKVNTIIADLGDISGVGLVHNP